MQYVNTDVLVQHLNTVCPGTLLFQKQLLTTCNDNKSSLTLKLTVQYLCTTSSKKKHPSTTAAIMEVRGLVNIFLFCSAGLLVETLQGMQLYYICLN